MPLAVQEVVAEWLRVEARRRLGEAALRAAAGRQELRALRQIYEQRRRPPAGSRPRPGGQRRRRAVCPFKGLASFDVADADSFYGREQVVAELVARLPGATLLGVVGPSGSGKSSIVRAGFQPRLRTAHSPARRNGCRS